MGGEVIFLSPTVAGVLATFIQYSSSSKMSLLISHYLLIVFCDEKTFLISVFFYLSKQLAKICKQRSGLFCRKVTLRTVSEGFLGVSRLAFIAANVMQTLRTIPCAHMQQSRDGGEKGPHFWEAGWLQPSKTPALQDHQTCVAKGSFYSDFLWEISGISASCFLETSAFAVLFPILSHCCS